MSIYYQHTNWQQMVGEYLMFFQNNTCSKFTIGKNLTLFFHQFNQPKVWWHSGDIDHSSVQDLPVVNTYHLAIPE